MARFIVTFTGRSTSGVITDINSLQVGDVPLFILNQAYANQPQYFVPFVLNDDELVQSVNIDLSGNTYTALIERHVMSPS